MPSFVSNNKRIVKNTLALYVRMLLTIAINLYTVRVLLDILGVEDYGIYNVVGGIVALLGFLNGTLAGGIQRFLLYSIGKGDTLEETRKIFSFGVLIQSALAIVILLLAETVGLWFFSTQLNIPADRMSAAHWVYQFSVFASLLSILQVPYNAAIIANERMSIFAYISVLDAVLKLSIVYLVLVTPFDKLIVYAGLIVLVNIIILCIYRIYCKRSFSECHFRYSPDRKLFQSMLSFSGWDTFGSLSSVLSTQGVNILLNIFFGPTINAARAIAVQVNSAVCAFANNFQLAVKPQIVKLHAAENLPEMHNLIKKSSLYAFFLISFLTFPLISEIDFVLALWLKEPPKETALFCRIILVQTFFYVIDRPLVNAVHAIGRMKIPNLTAGIVYLCVLPVSYLLLNLDFPSYTPFLVSLATFPLAMTIDLFILRAYSGFSIFHFLKEVVLKGIITVIPVVVVLCFIYNHFDPGLCRFLLISITSCVLLIFSVYYIGVDKSDRNLLINWIKNKKNKNG